MSEEKELTYAEHIAAVKATKEKKDKEDKSKK